MIMLLIQIHNVLIGDSIYSILADHKCCSAMCFASISIICIPRCWLALCLCDVVGDDDDALHKKEFVSFFLFLSIFASFSFDRSFLQFTFTI